MQTLTDALDLARRGFRVFRIAANSRGGRGEFPDYDWVTSATSDPVEVFERFNGEYCNIGVLADGILVVDVDVKNGKRGLESAETLNLDWDTFTVRTTTGGLHLYYDAKGVRYRNSVEQIAPGIDVRGVNGYVVGPGSQINGKFYTIERDLPLAPLPAEFAQRLAEVVDRKAEGATLGELDTPHAVQAAKEYLERAPTSIEGQGGNDTAYKVANRVLDYGLSAERALELMQDWNARCIPPWSDDELERTLANAAQYRQEAIGRDNPAEGFEPVPPDLMLSSDFAARVKPYTMTERDEELLPPRPWLAMRRLIRGKITALVAPGSVGKSLLSLQWAVAVALKDGKPFGLDVKEQANVLVINEEDEIEEMEMRLAAVLQYYGIERERLHGKLFLYSGVNHKFLAVRRKGRGLEPTEQLADLKTFMRANAIGLAIVDPLVESHEADENSNTEMAMVMSHWRSVASETGAALLIIHHTRKPPQADSEGFAGSADAGRGASAFINAARIGLTLFAMTKKECKALGIREDKRNRYIRLDDGKVNLTLQSVEAEWFERITVELKNGEKIGVLKPVVLATKKGDDREAIRAIIARALEERDQLTISDAAALLKADTTFEDVSRTSLVRRLAECTDLEGLKLEKTSELAGVFRRAD